MCRRILTALLWGLLATSLVSAQTVIPGGYVSGTWEASGSPFLVEGEITVHADSTLTIAPACTVIFQGYYKFIVNGFLEAVGTETDSILFTAANTITGWHGIRFLNAPDNSHLSYCIVQYGRATGPEPDYHGGGIFCSTSSPVISHCTIRECSAEVSGGGIGSILNSNPQILNCLIENCSSFGGGGEGGGGLACGYDSNPVIDGCTFSGNYASNSGGGIGSAYNALPTISNCTITGNSAGNIGGGIGMYQSSPTISNCTISGNSSLDVGGGIYCQENSNPSISTCTITGNNASSNGGGIYCTENSSPTIDNCTFSDNVADLSGGGIFCDDSSPDIIDCGFISNSANGNTRWSGGGGIYLEGSPATITGCTFTSNSADSSGGGVLCRLFSHAAISNCTFENNTSSGWGGGLDIGSGSNATVDSCFSIGNTAWAGGGVFFWMADPTLSNCTISDNTASWGAGMDCQASNGIIEGCVFSGNIAYQYGGGVRFAFGGNYPTIRNCAIFDNSAWDYGGGISCLYNHPTIENCTVSRNYAVSYGNGIDLYISEANIVNTIVEGNTGSGGSAGIYFYDAPNASFSYGDLYGNMPADFGGGVPAGFGVISGVNINGHPCDDYFNIFEDPLFVDPVNWDLHLQAGSPCIDAGDPASPPDPDGTIADMGAFYYDQGSVPNLIISLTPYNPPIQIPASGGSFDYNIAAENLGTSPTFTHVWCDVMLPNGSVFGPVLGPVQITMAAGITIDRDRIQNVPAGAPEGIYTFNAYLGGYPDLVWVEDHFDFEKLATGDGVLINDWNNYGEPFEEWFTALDDAVLPTEYSLDQNYPNPFNPTTTLTFALPEAVKVKLAVYDVSGRLVATLVDGWRDAGNHQVTFDGSALASGVYFYNFTAGQHEASGKMVLMK